MGVKIYDRIGSCQNIIRDFIIIRQFNENNSMISFPCQDQPVTPQQLHLLQQVLAYLKGNSEVNAHEFFSTIINTDPSNTIPILHYSLRLANIILQNYSNYTFFHVQLRLIAMFEKLLATCEPLYILVLEVYLLPLLARIATEALPIHQSASTNGQLFVKCVQIMLVWSGVKPRRLFEGIQMSEESSFSKVFTEFVEEALQLDSTCVLRNQEEQICTKFGIDKENVEKQGSLLRRKFVEKLGEVSEQSKTVKSVTGFYLQKIVVSRLNKLTSPIASTINSNNPHLQIDHILSTPPLVLINQLPEPQFSLLYQTLDPFFSSSLVKFIFDHLSQLHSFQYKTVCIHLLSDLVKWGDIQTYLAITYSEVIEEITYRVAEVRGEKSLDQGKKIYPQIPIQKGKAKFYIQFLRFLEIFGVCVEEDLQNQIEAQKIRELYTFLKFTKKFKFPQNLMLKRIQQHFKIIMKENLQRNTYFLNVIKQTPSSVYNESKTYDNKTDTFNRISQIDKIIDELASQDVETVRRYIRELMNFEEQYEAELEGVEQESFDDQLFDEYLEKGEKVISKFMVVKNLCKRFLAMDITVSEFRQRVKENLHHYHLNKQSEHFRSQRMSSKISHQEKDMSFHLSHLSKHSHDLYSKIGNRTMKSLENMFIQANQSLTEQQKSILSVKSIDLNEAVKAQNKKFKYFDHSASYSSLRSRQSLFKKKKKSNRIENILGNMKRLYNNQENKSILTNQGKVKTLERKNSDEIRAPSLQPSLFSVAISESESMNFKDCLKLQNEMIKETNFAKVYLKHKTRTIDKWQLVTKSEDKLKESQTCGSQTTAGKKKNN